MPESIDDVLKEHPGVQVVRRPTTELGTYVFRIGSLQPEITVRLFRAPHGNGVAWEQSHFIKTPTQLSRYATSRTWDDDASHALHRAIKTISDYYDQALQNHPPQDSWLVPNPGFEPSPRVPRGDLETMDAVEALLYVTLRLAQTDGDKVTFAAVAEEMNRDFVGRDDAGGPEWTAGDVSDLSEQARPLVALARRLARAER